VTAGQTGVVHVRELLGQELVELQLSVLSGESSLDREITHPRVQKPGLAFAGHYEYIKPGRVQIIGASETEFLRTLTPELRTERFESIAAMPIPAFTAPRKRPMEGSARRAGMSANVLTV